MGKRISLEQLRPDMVLAADIVDDGGRLLLPSGVTLTEKHVRYCQMWGVIEVEISTGEGAVEEEPSVIDPAMLARAEARVLPRFNHVDRAHPVIEVLFRHAVHHQLAKKS